MVGTILMSCKICSNDSQVKPIQELPMLLDLLWLKLISFLAIPTYKARKIKSESTIVGLLQWAVKSAQMTSQKKSVQALLLLLDLFVAEISIMAIPTHFLLFLMWHRKLISSKLHQSFCCNFTNHFVVSIYFHFKYKCCISVCPNNHNFIKTYQNWLKYV